MTKIKFGSIVTSAAGKLGGHVFARSPYGGTLRNKAIPVNRNTPAQQNIRSNFRHLATSWRALTEDQRATWNAAVDLFLTTNVFGNSYAPTGQLLFTRLNLNLLNAEQPIIYVAPLPVSLIAVELTRLFIYTPSNIIFLRWKNPAANQTMLVSLTNPMSQGPSNVRTNYKQLRAVTQSVLTQITLREQFVAIYGYPPVGSTVHAKVISINNLTGQATIPQYISGLTF